MDIVPYASRPSLGGNMHTWNTDAFPDPGKLRGGSEWKLNLAQSFQLQYSFTNALQGDAAFDISGASPSPELFIKPYGSSDVGALPIGTGSIDADPADGGIIQNRVTFTIDKDWGSTSGLELFAEDQRGAIVLFTVIQNGSRKFTIRERLNVEDGDFNQTGQTAPSVPIQLAYNPTWPADWNKYGIVPGVVSDALDTLAAAGKTDWGVVVSATTTTPPGSPVRSGVYVVAAGSTGDWAGQDGNLAIYDDVNTVWTFLAPFEGMKVRALDTFNQLVYSSGNWVNSDTLIDHSILLNLNTGNPHPQYAQLVGDIFTGNIEVPAALSGNQAPNLSQVETLINNAISGKTDQGTVSQRLIVPPAHSAGLRILVDENLGVPSGDFAGQGNTIATSDGASWSFETPLEGWFVWVDDENKQYSYDADADNWFASAAGETNTGANVGSGVGTFDGKVVSELQFRSITGLEGFDFSLNGQTIEGKPSFNGLSAHTPISADSLWIYDSVAGDYKKISYSDLPSANTAASLGTGIGTFKDQVGNVLNFRSILQNANNILGVALVGDDIVLTIQPSDESTVGASRFATEAEVDTGAANTIAVSPLNLNSIYQRKKVVRNTQTGTSYAPVLADFTDRKTITMDNAGANAVTLPLDSTVNAAIDSTFEVFQFGSGQTTIDGESGVIINGVLDGSVTIDAQYKGAFVWKIAADTYIVEGAVT